MHFLKLKCEYDIAINTVSPEVIEKLISSKIEEIIFDLDGTLSGRTQCYCVKGSFVWLGNIDDAIEEEEKNAG